MLNPNSIEGYGMKTESSDNIKDVMSYEFYRELESRQKKKHENFLELKNTSLSKANDTKASIMRNEAIKKRLNESSISNRHNQYLYKLKQFINVPSSDYIRNIKKRYKTKREPSYNNELDNIHQSSATLLLQKHLGHTRGNKSLDNFGTPSHKNRNLNMRSTTNEFPDIKNRSIEVLNRA